MIKRSFVTLFITGLLTTNCGKDNDSDESTTPTTESGEESSTTGSSSTNEGALRVSCHTEVTINDTTSTSCFQYDNVSQTFVDQTSKNCTDNANDLTKKIAGTEPCSNESILGSCTYSKGVIAPDYPEGVAYFYSESDLTLQEDVCTKNSGTWSTN